MLGVYYRRLRVNNGLLAQKEPELSVRSSRDPLTALYNRRYFQEFMRDAARAQPSAGAAASRSNRSTRCS